MDGNVPATAQLVMKRADGTSILDLSGPTTAESADLSAGDLSDSRIDEIQGRLESLGFTIEQGNRNTLSISGDVSLFVEVFGLDPNAAATNATAAHATRIRPELEPFVADVFVTPGPELFP